MIKWITKIHWGKVILVGFLFTLVSTVIHNIEAMLMLKYYMMPQYFGVWSKIMMPSAGPPPMQFFVISILMTFTSGVSLAIIYYYLREYLPKGYFRRVTYFADLMAATSLVFFTLPVFLMFNVPLPLLGSWFISTFITLVAASIIIVKVLR
jgi:hypothetical protein